MKVWSAADDELLRTLALRGLSEGEIAKRLQRNKSSVRGRARRLRWRLPVIGTGWCGHQPVQLELPEINLKGEAVMPQNQSLLLGISIGLFCALAVLALRYVAGVLAG
jgi:hypothetical protein